MFFLALKSFFKKVTEVTTISESMKIKKLGDTLTQKLNRIELNYTINKINNFYLFSIYWTITLLLYNTINSFVFEDEFSLAFYIINISTIIYYFYIYKYYLKNIDYTEKFKLSFITIFSCWLLSFNQFLYIHNGVLGNVGGLYSIYGVIYGLLIALFCFLPSWKMTVYASLGSLVFLLIHQYPYINSELQVNKLHSIFNISFIFQIIIEFLFFVFFGALSNSKKEESANDIKKAFFKKIISNAHLKVMNSTITTKILDYKISGKTIPYSFLSSADLLLYEKNSKGEVIIAIGDVVGHGLDASSGSFMCCTIIRSLILNDIDPPEIINTINKLLLNIPDTDGGEIFIQLIKLKPGGEVEIYGHPAGKTEHNGKELSNLFFLIIGKKQAEFNKENLKKITILMKNKDKIFSCTDGWLFDEDDDRTFVKIEYLGE